MLTPEFEPMMTRLMGSCIVMRAEFNYMGNAIHYEAYSFRFRELDEGEIIPNYDFFFDAEGGMTAVESGTKGGAA